jgi:hypothetical protein
MIGRVLERASPEKSDQREGLEVRELPGEPVLSAILVVAVRIEEKESVVVPVIAVGWRWPRHVN